MWQYRESHILFPLISFKVQQGGCVDGGKQKAKRKEEKLHFLNQNMEESEADIGKQTVLLMSPQI